MPFSMTEIYMMVGFLMAGYAVVANDAIQTLGTFLVSNSQRPWWLLWLFAGGVLVAVFLFGYFTQDGDVSFGRLAKIPEVTTFSWWMLIPPAVLLGLTRLGIPVSTTFLILTAFNPRGLGSMLTKSLLGYGVALVVGYLVYRLVMRSAERRFIETAKRKPAPYWVALQWLSKAFLWSQWLIQDLANIAVYLPRKIGIELLIVVIAVMLALHAWIFYLRGGKIQRIVTTKINTSDIRSATVIDFIYGVILFVFKELSNVPMSTTWVFLGLLAGREFAVGFNTMLRSHRETTMLVIKDAFKGAIGLAASVAVAFGVTQLF